MKFFKYGISIFDARDKKYGGFNHFIAGKIFRWKFDYLDISFTKKFKIGIMHENDYAYYDGYHNHIWLGFVQIDYGT